MRIEVLTVPGCPNGPVLTQRLATVLGDDPEVPVVQRSVADPEEVIDLGERDRVGECQLKSSIQPHIGSQATCGSGLRGCGSW